MVVKSCKKVADEYFCEKCDYSTSRKSSFDKHLLSRKHKMVVNGSKNGSTEITSSTTNFECVCGSVYKYESGFYRHKKSCKKLQKVANELETESGLCPTNLADANNMISELKSMVVTLVSQNKEMHSMIATQSNTIVEMTKNTGINNNNVNSNNKTFNLNFFLNDTCKDAMNITDFVNSLKLTLTDLEKVGELGYAEGISRMFMRGLSELDVTRRPIHCSDLKREVIHIKDHDKWERDTDNQDKLREAIKNLSSKNIMLLDDWKRQNPGCTNYDNNKNELYLKIQCESMGPGSNKEEKRDFSKIVRAVAKHTIIQKTLGCSD